MTFKPGDKALYDLDGKGNPVAVVVVRVNNSPASQLVDISGHGIKAAEGCQKRPDGEAVLWVWARNLRPAAA